MRGRAYRWLAAIPAVGIIVGVPIANRVQLYVFGLPLLLAWILACVLLTSGLMALIEGLDRRRDAEEARSRFNR
jgi:hypothetical protein